MDNELQTAALNIARYFHDQKFELGVVSGGSHSVAHGLFAAAWRRLYPEEPVPKTIVLDAETNYWLYKSEIDAKIDPKEREAKVRDMLSTKYPELAAAKDQSLCFIEEFANTGKKAQEILQLFHKLGYREVKFAIMAAGSKAEVTSEMHVGIESHTLMSRLDQVSRHIQGSESNWDRNVLSDREIEAKSAPEYRQEGLDQLRGMVGEVKRK